MKYGVGLLNQCSTGAQCVNKCSTGFTGPYQSEGFTPNGDMLSLGALGNGVGMGLEVLPSSPPCGISDLVGFSDFFLFFWFWNGDSKNTQNRVSQKKSVQKNTPDGANRSVSATRYRGRDFGAEFYFISMENGRKP